MYLDAFECFAVDSFQHLDDCKPDTQSRINAFAYLVKVFHHYALLATTTQEQEDAAFLSGVCLHRFLLEGGYVDDVEVVELETKAFYSHAVTLQARRVGYLTKRQGTWCFDTMGRQEFSVQRLGDIASAVAAFVEQQAQGAVLCD